ncbi:hypothetical protein GCM10022419_101320 [Nonomuraea rosea]|uniref:Peptidase inhibitor family I36 protein n=1 Tax=Nonomuraea rosea TaxID=638574 RepID=A0ABP6Z9J5_9ACTN
MRVRGKIALLAVLSLAVAGLIAPPAHSDPTPQPQEELTPAGETPVPERSTTYEDDSPADSQRAAAPAWRCHLFVSDPAFVRHNGRGHISGIGRQWCTGAGYAPHGPRLTLQRYLGVGIWRNVHRTSIAWSRGSFAESLFDWPCTGTGVERYRWVVDGFAAGVPRVRANAYSLNPRRIYC